MRQVVSLTGTQSAKPVQIKKLILNLLPGRPARLYSLLIFILLLGAGLLRLVFVSLEADAATFNVGCGPTSGADLISAIDLANSNAEADVINLTAGCTYTLSFPHNFASGPNGLPAITSQMTLNGNGATIERVSSSNFRLFFIASSGHLTLNNLNLLNGKQTSVEGGGLYNQGILTLTDSTVRYNTVSAIPAGPEARGGGVYNSGTLTLNNSTISHNHAENLTNLTGTAAGGGLYNTGTLILNNSTISNNNAASLDISSGGGFYHTGSLTMTNTTLAGNTAFNGGGLYLAGGIGSLTNSTISGNEAENHGGGIYEGSGTFNLNNVTITDNVADQNGDNNGNGGGIYRAGGTINFKNSLLADNIDNSSITIHSDCSGLINSQGYNLLEDTTGCTVGGDTTGNITGLDPQLASLADNGGSTQTQALRFGSPAFNAGNPAPPGSGGQACAGTDQRGILRPQLGRCDIGAFEARLGLTLTKIASNTTPNPGELVTYRITVENSGDITATNAAISDTLPAGLTFAGPVGLQGSGGVVAANPGDLPALASGLTIQPQRRITVTFPVTVNAAVADYTIITNTAAVTSQEVTIPQSGFETIQVIVNICPAGPTISFEPANPQPGEAVRFEGNINAGEGPITFTWRFGDGSTLVRGQSLQHSYNLSGIYTVVLTTTGELCKTPPTAMTQITVGFGPPYTIFYLPLVSKNSLRIPVSTGREGPARPAIEARPEQVTGLDGYSDPVAGLTYLAWRPNSPADRVHGYHLYRRSQKEGETFDRLVTLPAGVTTYRDHTAACGYIYWVTAYNTAGESRPSSTSYYSPPCQGEDDE